jgi:lysophospholipase L1-like esterase
VGVRPGTAGDDREQPRAGGFALVAVWGVGVVAAVARIGPRDRGDVVAVVALGVLAAGLVRLLQQQARGWRLPDLAALVVVVGTSAVAWRTGFAYSAAVVAVGTVLAYGALVRWSLPASWPRRVGRVAGPALGILLVDMWLWYRDGSPAVFGLLALLVLAVLELWARAPSLAAHVDRLAARLGHVVGTAVTALLTGAVMVVVVVPVHLVSRLFGYSPLDSGWTSASTAWITVDRSRLRAADGSPAGATSMSSLELAPATSVRRRSRLRLAVPGLALVALAAVTLPMPGWLPWAGEPSDGAPEPAGTFTREFEDDPAFEDAPWAENVRLGLLDAWTNLEFNAALGGWTIKDVSSEYVNVADGERATLPPDPALGEPITVWLFGGSAAFGAGQRDEHTIASELVSAAAADGVALDVHNFAVPATVNWQSAMLVIERLKWADPPDLIVVYDGANDMALQDALAAQGKGSSDRPASLIDAEMDELLRERATERGAARDLLPPSDVEVDDEPPSPEESARHVLTRYRKGVEVIRMFGEAAAVPVVVVWQPDLRAKSPLSEVDRSTLVDVGIDVDQLDDWSSMSTAVRAELAAMGVVDLTTVFDGRDDAIYWDAVHTNETGSLLVADAMYDRLRPQLSELATEGPG